MFSKGDVRRHVLPSLARPGAPWRVPEQISGEGSLAKLPAFAKKKGWKSALLVTDQGLMSLGMAQPIIDGFKAEGLNITVYDKVIPNPTITNIEEGLKLYNDNKCDVIIALGGGSPMDCAKGIGRKGHRRTRRPSRQTHPQDERHPARHEETPPAGRYPHHFRYGQRSHSRGSHLQPRDAREISHQRPRPHPPLCGDGSPAHGGASQTHHLHDGYGRAHPRGGGVHRRREHFQHQEVRHRGDSAHLQVPQARL